MKKLVTFVQEFTHDDPLILRIQQLKEAGIDTNNIYIFSDDEDHTRQAIDESEVNVMGLSEIGWVNLFSEKEEKIRHQLQKIGFNETETKSLQQKLNQGKTLLIIPNYQIADDQMYTDYADYFQYERPHLKIFSN